MRAGKRLQFSEAFRMCMTVVTLLVTGCSKPEEVISRRIIEANQNLEAGRVDAAVDMLEKLNRQHPDQPAVLEALGFAYARSGRHDAAAASFVRAADLDPNSYSLRQLAAESFLHDGAADRAAEQHRLYLREFPGDFQSWKRLGEIEEQRGDLIRASDAYLESYRLRPGGEVAFQLGTIFRKLNNAPQAKAWFDTTIRHGDAHVDGALLGLLELEFSARNFAAAERTIAQLDENFPGALNASPLVSLREEIARWKESQKTISLARTQQEGITRELEEARQRQQQELAELAATSAPAAATATASSIESSAPAAPLVSATPPDAPTEPEPSAISRAEEPSDPATVSAPPDLLAAREMKEADDIDRAIELLWEALGGDADNVAIWMELADCYRLQKQYADAEACISEAMRRAPDSLAVEFARLEITREGRSTEIYLARLDAARRKFPSDPTLAYLFARELAASEATLYRAVSAYEDFLLLASPDDPRRAEATEFLSRLRRR